MGYGWFNGEHEPREAAATDSPTRTDRIGCLPLAQCSGSAILLGGSASETDTSPILIDIRVVHFLRKRRKLENVQPVCFKAQSKIETPTGFSREADSLGNDFGIVKRKSFLIPKVPVTPLCVKVIRLRRREKPDRNCTLLRCGVSGFFTIL